MKRREIEEKNKSRKFLNSLYSVLLYWVAVVAIIKYQQ